MLKRNLIAILSAIMVLGPVFGMVNLITSEVSGAGTEVSGMIMADQQWTTDNDPYIVVDNLTIGIGVMIVIEPGVEVRVDPGLTINIDGALRAEGTSEEPILFTANESSPQPGSWNEMRFRDNSDDANCILSHIIIEYAAGISAEQATPTIEYSIIRYSSGDGLRYNNVQNDLTLSYNTFENNNGNGLYLESMRNVVLFKNIFRSNGLAGIYLGWTEYVTLSVNTIENNSDAGISFSSSGWADMTIQNNDIRNNNNSGLQNRNDWDDWTRTIVVQYNTLLNNTPYDIKGGKGNIDATNNWWGTTTPGDIPPRIYDYYDNNEFGLVSYQPMLDGPAPRLINPQVTPSSGDTTTTFQFSITYEDEENELADSIKVNLIDYGFWPPDVNTYTMLETNSSDTITSDGKDYYIELQFTQPGNLDYNFSMSKGSLNITTSNSPLNVDVGPLDHINVWPDDMTLTVNQQQNINPEGRDVYDNYIPGIDFVYTVNNSLVTVQDDGFGGKEVVAGTVTGESEINISYNGVWVLVPVHVHPGEPFILSITPTNVSVQVTQDQWFTAEGFDEFGNPIPEESYWWDTWVDWDMPWMGNIEQFGNTAVLHSANQVTEGKVRVNCGGLTVESNVTLVPGPIDHMQMEPNFPNLEVNTSMNFTGFCRDEWGNNIPELEVYWTIESGMGLATLSAGTGNEITLDAGTNTGQLVIRASNESGAIFSETDVYINPGPMASIAIEPAEIIIPAGSWYDLNARAYDEFGNEIFVWDYSWILVSDPGENVGSLSSTEGDWVQLQAAEHPANGTITLTYSSFEVQKQVRVIHGDLNRLELTPNNIDIEVGESVQLTVTGFDWYENPIPDFPVTWMLNPYPELGFLVADPMDNHTVTFTANTTVNWGQIDVQSDWMQASAWVNIYPGPLDHVVIDPSSAVVTVADWLYLQATGYDIYNNPIPGMEFNWTVEGDIGSLTDNFCEFNTLDVNTYPGSGSIMARNGSINATCDVTVEVGSLWYLDVTPWEDVLRVGETAAFTAQGYDDYNNPIPGLTYNWEIIGNGSFDSNDTRSVNFTANTIPEYVLLNVTCDWMQYWVSIAVIPGVLDSIAISPASLTIQVGDWHDFNAEGFDAYGNIVDYMPDPPYYDPGSGPMPPGPPPIPDLWIEYQWNITGDIGWLGNYMGDWTNLQANNYPGTGEVIAFFGQVNATVSIEVVVGPVEYIQLTPESFCVEVGTSAMIEVQAFDMFGNPIADALYDWALDGPGSLDSTSGICINYTAETVPGYALLNVSVDGRRALAFIGITPGELASIVVNPSSIDIEVGWWQNFEAQGYDSYGNLIEYIPAPPVNDPEVPIPPPPPFPFYQFDFNWSVHGGIGWLNMEFGMWNEFYAEITPGSGYIDVKLDAINTTVNVNVHVGPLDQLEVYPWEDLLTVGENAQFSAQGYDWFHNPIPGLTYNWQVEGDGSLNVYEGSMVQYTALTTPGYSLLNVTCDWQQGWISLAIIPGPLEYITIMPDTLEIEVGWWSDFEAIGFDEYDNRVDEMPQPPYYDPGEGPMPPGPPPIPDLWLEFEWNLSGDVGWLGNDFGNWNNFQANTYPGIGGLNVSYGEVYTFVPIEVVHGPVEWIELSPNSFIINVAQTQMLEAQAFDQFGNPIEEPVYSWTLEGLGSLDADNGNAVYFQAALVPGYSLVNVTVDDRLAMAFIGIIPGELTTIQITPSNIDIEVGQWIELYAEGYDALGNKLEYIEPPYIEFEPGLFIPSMPYFPEYNLDFHWIVYGDIGWFENDLGMWNGFNAQTHPGEGYMDVGLGDVNLTMNISVHVGPMDRLEMYMDTDVVVVNETSQYSVQIFDWFENPIPDVSYAWSLGNDLATLEIIDDTTVELLAGTLPGMTNLAVEINGFSQVMDIWIIPGALSSITLDPSSATTSAVESVQISAQGFDEFGNPVEIAPAWWAETGGIDESGHYVPDPMSDGAFEITCEQEGVLQTAEITVNYDSDSDEMPDWWESENELDIYTANAFDDLDDGGYGDGLTNLQEFLNGTDPQDGDTDNDGLGDGVEIIVYDTEPLTWDSDHNGLSDGLEVTFGANMNYLPSGWIAMTIQWDVYTMDVQSSSSVLDVSFDQENQQLTIRVSGEDGTAGETNITIPKELVNTISDILIQIDGETIGDYEVLENTTHYLIHITYHHSTHDLTTSFDKSDVQDASGSNSGMAGGATTTMIAGLGAMIAIVIVVLIMLKKKRPEKGSSEGDEENEDTGREELEEESGEEEIEDGFGDEELEDEEEMIEEEYDLNQMIK